VSARTVMQFVSGRILQLCEVKGVSEIN